MTTPEKQRRREFVFIGLVASAMATFVLLSFWQNGQDAAAERRDEARDARQNAQFQTCITDTVKSLVEALTARSDLTSQESKSITNLIAGLLNADQDPQKAQRAIDQYVERREAIAITREKNPYPPFPNGKCDFTAERAS